MMAGSTASYTAMILAGGMPEPQPLPATAATEGEDDEDLGPLDGPKVLSSVKLAQTPGDLHLSFPSSELIIIPM